MPDRDTSDKVSGSFLPIDAKHVHSGQVWHYTDTVGFHGIVTKGELFATDAVMLNDPEELTYGAAIIRSWYVGASRTQMSGFPAFPLLNEYLENLEDELRDHPAFVVCASADLQLSQWRNYASNSGYAVQLSTDALYGIVDGEDESGRPTSSTPADRFTLIPSWVKVIYNEVEQIKRVAEVLRSLGGPGGQVARFLAMDDEASAAVLIRSKVAALAASMKHPAYHEENEVRLIGYQREDVNAEHRPGGRGMIPYLRVIATDHRAPAAYVRSQVNLPIIGVRVGPPGGDSERQRIHGAKSLLHTNGFKDVQPSGSEIPFLP